MSNMQSGEHSSKLTESAARLASTGTGTTLRTGSLVSRLLSGGNSGAFSAKLLPGELASAYLYLSTFCRIVSRNSESSSGMQLVPISRISVKLRLESSLGSTHGGFPLARTQSWYAMPRIGLSLFVDFLMCSTIVLSKLPVPLQKSNHARSSMNSLWDHFLAPILNDDLNES